MLHACELRQQDWEGGHKKGGGGGRQMPSCQTPSAVVACMLPHTVRLGGWPEKPGGGGCHHVRLSSSCLDMSFWSSGCISCVCPSQAHSPHQVFADRRFCLWLLNAADWIHQLSSAYFLQKKPANAQRISSQLPALVLWGPKPFHEFHQVRARVACTRALGYKSHSPIRPGSSTRAPP